jgi:cation:H+ antiporter
MALEPILDYIGGFPASHPYIFLIAIIVASFIIMVKSADMLVFGIDRYAKKEGLSDFLIGLLIVSFTASTPELVSSITGLFAGDNGIVFGTILGSNITGLTLVLGIYALVGRKLKLYNKVLAKMEVIIFFLIVVPFFLGADGELSRYDGMALIAVYLSYVVFVWIKEAKAGKMKKDVKLRFIWKDALIFLLALFALFLSSRWLVFSSITAANLLKIPTFLMAIIVLGIASSLPDLLVGIRAILAGDVGIGVGNSLGSIIVKAIFFFGLLSVIRPLPVDLNGLAVTIGATLLSLSFILYLSERQEMDWKHGLMLLFIYISYILAETFKSVLL